MAFKWALETFKYYVLGRDLILEIDHRGLQWLYKMSVSNPRISIWVLERHLYRCGFQYWPGSANVVADFLSYHPNGESPREGEMWKDSHCVFTHAQIPYITNNNHRHYAESSHLYLVRHRVEPSVSGFVFNLMKFCNETYFPYLGFNVCLYSVY